MQSQLEIMKCDRCGRLEEYREPHKLLMQWGSVLSTFTPAFPRYSSKGGAADLCPDCQQSFDAWWIGGAQAKELSERGV